MWSPSLVPSFGSWHGIDGPKQQLLPQPDKLQELPLPPNQPFNQFFLPIDQKDMLPDDPQEPFFQPNPFSMHTPTNSMGATPPPDIISIMNVSPLQLSHHRRCLHLHYHLYRVLRPKHHRRCSFYIHIV
jgi:hypothetical protein